MACCERAGICEYLLTIEPSMHIDHLAATEHYPKRRHRTSIAPHSQHQYFARSRAVSYFCAFMDMPDAMTTSSMYARSHRHHCLQHLCL
jgi:hypothetical protein